MTATTKRAGDLQRGDIVRGRVVEEVVHWRPTGGPDLVDVRFRGSRAVHTFNAQLEVEVQP